MANKKRRSSLPLTLLIVLAILIVALLLIKEFQSMQANHIDNFPTLMEAQGKVNASPGEFMLEKQASIGNPDAPVKVIEFLDYKCPVCSVWTKENMETFKRDYVNTGKVQLYTIHFPFLGPDSIVAAMIGESIAAQSYDAFYEYSEKLLANQGEKNTIWATEKFLLNFVKENIKGINFNLLKRDVEDRKHLFAVKEDFKISNANGVSGVPSFFVNGQQMDTIEYRDLTQTIDAFLLE